MKKTTIAALVGSLTLGLVLVFTLVLPASAQPWSDQMPGGNGERNNEEMRGECDHESMDRVHEQMGEMDQGMMNGSHGSMHQGDDMGDHHRDMHAGGEMGEMHRHKGSEMGTHMGNGHHGNMHGNGSMGTMHGSMMDSDD